MTNKLTGTSTNQSLWYKIGHLGLTPDLKPYEKAKGLVFNYVNFFGLFVSVLRIIYLLFVSSKTYTDFQILVNVLPAAGCTAMIVMMYYRKPTATIYFSFLVFPGLLFYIFLVTQDRGVLFYLIPYMIYPFFFLNRKRKIIPAFILAATFFAFSFIVEALQHNDSHDHDLYLELISFIGSMGLIFLTLYSIKYQLWHYQAKIKKQQSEIQERNDQLAVQSARLEETNKIKDKVFSIISHDLNTPIQGLQLLFEHDESNPEEMIASLVEVLPELKNELRKTSDLFENLLYWAKMQIREAEVVTEQMDVGELASKIKSSLIDKARKKGVQIENRLSNTKIYGDKYILEIVLRNLVSNAIKFSRDEDKITINGIQEKNAYVLRVTDTGIGMNEESIRKINSNSFYTSYGTQNEKGTGLGLIICKDLIEKCSGFINIESSLGKGTAISIYLPVMNSQ
jgi:two-component system, sensor histidine kinase and response regulator